MYERRTFTDVEELHSANHWASSSNEDRTISGE